MLRIILPIIFICAITNVHAQDCHSCLNFKVFNEANLLYSKDKKDNSQSLMLYRQVLVDNKFGDLSHIYNTLNKVFNTDSIQLIKDLFAQAVSKGATKNDLENFLVRYPFVKLSFNDMMDTLTYKRIQNAYLTKLDSFLINELLSMVKRDQYVRTNKQYNSKMKNVDSTNAVLLMNLIKTNNNQLPTYTQIGTDGYDALVVIMIHMDIEDIVKVFPYVYEGLRKNEYYDNESLLYQIDRNHIGGKIVYRYESTGTTLKHFIDNKMFNPTFGYYQYYGGMDLWDEKTRSKYYWPFHPDRDMEIVKELYAALCLPTNNANNKHFKQISDFEFISIFNQR